MSPIKKMGMIKITFIRFKISLKKNINNIKTYYGDSEHNDGKYKTKHKHKDRLECS